MRKPPAIDSNELLKQLRENGITPQTRPLVSTLLINGPPHVERKMIWLEITGAGLQLRENPIYYSTLISTKISIETSVTRQIDRDLHRTFPNENFFDRKTHMTALRNVLVAYSWRNPSVGYCQGLNFIVGRLMTIGFSEEESFWMLSQIVETYLPLDYFSIMTGVIVDQKVFGFLLQKKLGRIAKHLDRLEIDPSLYTVQWLVCMFAYSFPKAVVMRVWDLFFVEGSTFLFKCALGLLWLFRKEIVKIKDFNDAFTYMENNSRKIVNPALVLEAANKRMFRFKGGMISDLRAKFREVVDKEIDSHYDDIVPVEQLLKTITDYCANENECKQKTRRTSSYFTFNLPNGVFIIDNYVDDDCVPKKFDTTNLRLSQDKLILGSKNHVCSQDKAGDKVNAYTEKEDLEEFLNTNLQTKKMRHARFSLIRSFSYTADTVLLEDNKENA
ncbi:unnamed protein product [Blepharisma stoltei]|uniref:Rab-GAP TBC domain-containing protein n=1 Tax=Blepharisma stoltei TaxID=1481888 RepID=A0AAU9J1K4_9CILI|nr:unnamed protein product [Blepharisma stoltei]